MVYELAAYTDNKDGESFILRENLGQRITETTFRPSRPTKLTVLT